MAIFRDIIQQLGNDIWGYNALAWDMFRDQIINEMSSHYMFGDDPKSDETLLGYSMDYIENSNKIVRGQKSSVNGFKKPDFTYYTDEPTTQIGGKPVLPDPINGTLKIKSDFKPYVGESTKHKLNGGSILEVYDEQKHLTGKTLRGVLDGVSYSTDVTQYENGETLLSKTKNWFNGTKKDYISKRYATLISRFHTDNTQISEDEIKTNVGLQAGSSYGLSHGRNLLKVDGNGNQAKKTTSITNGYNDPYCRVWTWHKQYSRIGTDTMRPFMSDENKSLSQIDLAKDYNWGTFRTEASGTFGHGSFRLGKYGVMYDNNGHTNGLVNITPSMSQGSNDIHNPNNVSVEHCMFSIENLAWKGTFNDWDSFEEYGLSPEQKGPLGGRIMWFPPYDIKFTETTDSNWQQNDFIGRGEPMYTYANTQRNGTLEFKLLIDHPAILDYWERRDDIGTVEGSGVDNVESKEQELLRFFAGCSVLTAKPQQDGLTSTIAESEEDINKREEIELEDGQKKIQFFVFFPNNYSGRDDNIGGIIDPIEYLMNGVGAQLYTHIEEDEIDSSDMFELPTNPNMLYESIDFGVVHISDNNPNVIEDYEVGGYEMYEDLPGISIVRMPTRTNEICYIREHDSLNNIRLTKMVSNEAPVRSSLPDGNNLDKWNLCRYYYRCDKSELNDQFVDAESYIDGRSLGLNVSVKSELCDKYNLEYSDTFSMAEMFVAVYNKTNCDAVIKKIMKYSYESYYNRVNLLMSILKGEQGEIQSIHTTGMASVQGNNASQYVNTKQNIKLAEGRAKTINAWLMKKAKIDPSKFAEIQYIVDDDNSYKDDDSAVDEAKMNRFALVEIVYGAGSTEDASKTELQPTEGTSDVISNEDEVDTDADYEEEDEIVEETGSFGIRYDNEARFFEKLTLKEPFMAKLISERIKNFHPVFHSMSPEGFNARLTFLNQCMRQGPTISSSDVGWNSNNMSFGRPPVCVLRVGDFYNTKIIIRNMSINYDPLVWDLNQEGIGVMPMIANVSLTFSFIGGSDLGGPIQRLQNATSFNYYANTSVYDNRSEMIAFDKGKMIGFKAKPEY